MCRPILSVMLWVIGNHSFDYTPNWTSLGPTTIFNYLHETLNFLGVSMLIKISISKFIKGGLIFMLINEFTCLIPQAPLKTWTFMLFTIFYNLIFCQILLRIWFTFRASTNNFRYWKKMKNGQSSRFSKFSFASFTMPPAFAYYMTLTWCWEAHIIRIPLWRTHYICQR